MPVTLMQIGILMLAIFFCACYLPVLELTQDRAQQTIHSVALTAAGWSGIAVAKWLFHFSLTIVVAVVILLTAEPTLLSKPSLWATVIAATLAYLGLGFVVGSLCRSATTASAAIVAYGLLTAGLLYGAHHLAAAWLSYLALERNVIVSLLPKWAWHSDIECRHFELIALYGLACAWQLLGFMCFRRSIRGWFPA